MADERKAERCPRCNGTALDRGGMNFDVKFYRSSQWISTGWNFEAFVCLDCGLLTQYLSASDLEQLRAKNGLPSRST
jgi:hypothetical protein